jgi:DNA polymerase-1
LAKEKLKTRMTLQVHDELVFDVPEDEIEPVSTMVQHEMEHVIDLNVPLVADVGTGANWRDLN